MWPKAPDFENKVFAMWNRYDISGTPSFHLASKLKMLGVWEGWRQKLSIVVKEGDSNSKSFHRVEADMRNNFIESLKVNGEVFEEK